ncbi:MAG: gluconolaconase [Chitinophagaceae bacterium]|nr:MAG: gluconolaconase [Chitinophagaceae bacterium]
MKTRYIFTLTAAILIYGCVSQQPTERIEFMADEAYPEGVAFDSTANVYYVSSARLGTIGKVTPQGTYSVFYADNTLKSTYGVKVYGNKLLIAAGDANYSKFTSPDTRTKMARLLSIDSQSGKKLMDVDLSKLLPGKHFPNDIAVDPQGNIYITDSFAHGIYKVTPEGRASVFARDKMFETMGVGLNGIVYHPDGFLLASNTGTGQVYKIDIKDPTKVTKVQLDQYFLGADGLLLDDNNHLTVVVNGGNDKIFRLESTDGWQSAILSASTLASDRFTYPSTATRFQNSTWIMNAKFSELVDSNSVPSKNFAIQKAVFKPLPKPRD